MRLFRADEIVLSLGNEVSQWQEEVSIGPGGPARRNRIFGSGEIRDPENNVVFLDDMQPEDFFLIKKKRHQLPGTRTATAGVTWCAVRHAAPGRMQMWRDSAWLHTGRKHLGMRHGGPPTAATGALGPPAPWTCPRTGTQDLSPSSPHAPCPFLPKGNFAGGPYFTLTE